MKNKITVIGSSNVDLIMKMDHLPQLGETVTEADFRQTYGGKGANQAVAAARAGGDVYFVNCVGEDDFTEKMLESYRQDHLHLEYVFQEKGVPSGTALVMIGQEGENYLSVAPGANYKLSPHHIDQIESHLRETALIVLQYEIPAQTIEYTIRKADQLNIPVLWNFAPARHFDLKYLQYVEYLVVNEVEAEFLTGQKVEDQLQVEAAAQKLVKIGVKSVILTLGKRGAYYLSRDNSGIIPGYQVKAVDTTAAGDVFCGCLAVSLVEGKELPRALQFSNAAAALAVTRLGAQPSAPFRSEIDSFIQNN
ncbi:MAG: ribokinase [Candidatus Cyclobacteriaceae bacterium M3_2C_046]